jgi:hypothetical protein
MDEQRYIIFEPPPEPASDVHEARVEEVRDVTRDRKLVFRQSPNADTGLRSTFPLTYDVVLEPPAEQRRTSEDE